VIPFEESPLGRLGDGGGRGPARMGVVSGDISGGARWVLLLGDRWAGVLVLGSRVAADSGRGGRAVCLWCQTVRAGEGYVNAYLNKT
jgi:hypothetical protein